MARKLSHEWKVTARTAREVYEAAVNATTEAADIKFRGRKLGLEAFVNAALLYLLDLSPGERRRVLVEYVGRFERLMATEPEAPQASRYARPLGFTELRLSPPPSDDVGQGPEGEDEGAELPDVPPLPG